MHHGRSRATPGLIVKVPRSPGASSLLAPSGASTRSSVAVRPITGTAVDELSHVEVAGHHTRNDPTDQACHATINISPNPSRISASPRSAPRIRPTWYCSSSSPRSQLPPPRHLLVETPHTTALRTGFEQHLPGRQCLFELTWVPPTVRVMREYVLSERSLHVLGTRIGLDTEHRRRTLPRHRPPHSSLRAPAGVPDRVRSAVLRCLR